MPVKKEDYSSLGQLVREHRKNAGLTQKELADIAGVGKALIFDLEKGHENVQFGKLKSILKVLNIKVSFTPPSTPANSDKL